MLHEIFCTCDLTFSQKFGAILLSHNCSGDETFSPLFRNKTVLNQSVLQGHSTCELITVFAQLFCLGPYNFPPGHQVIIRMCNDPEMGASSCMEDGRDSSPEQTNAFQFSHTASRELNSNPCAFAYMCLSAPTT